MNAHRAYLTDTEASLVNLAEALIHAEFALSRSSDEHVESSSNLVPMPAQVKP